MNFNIVLYQPEIPQNTGNIGRTCVLTNSKLHLIKPLGFEINDKQLKRSGLDYWKDLDVTYYESFEQFYEINKDKTIYLSTTKANKNYSEVSYKQGDFIMFGRESSGVPSDVRELFVDTSIKIPMLETSDRSLNLSNSASIIVYEALRQIGFPKMK
jgi:tRNA (cytidine/uridine-2'-O-)-methyltransferase